MTAKARNRTGLALCGLYGVLSALSVLGSVLQSDPKGSFVLLQVPLVPALGLAFALGGEHYVEGMSWVSAYVVFMPATLAMLYAAGWAFGRLWSARHR